jgi:hypothetical protein
MLSGGGNVECKSPVVFPLAPEMGLKGVKNGVGSYTGGEGNSGCISMVETSGQEDNTDFPLLQASDVNLISESILL